MRNLHLLDAYRIDARETHGSMGDETCGCFRIPSPIDGQPLLIQASSDGGWDHISISRKNRPPNWTEMEFIKRKFFKDDETAMQLLRQFSHLIIKLIQWLPDKFPTQRNREFFQA
jgi:hypothetical protein